MFQHHPNEYILALRPYARATMQRDIHLIRKLLSEIERNNATMMSPPDVPGYPPEVVGHHLGLLDQGGFLEVTGEPTDSPSGPKFVIKDLTWEGHELANVLLNEGVWREMTTKLTQDELNSVPLDILEQSGRDLIRKWTSSKLGL
jgi:hypothetical protein